MMGKGSEGEKKRMCIIDLIYWENKQFITKEARHKRILLHHRLGKREGWSLLHKWVVGLQTFRQIQLANHHWA